jgi:hypothetical protein
MAWLGTVILVSAIGVGVIAGGVAAGPMQAMVEAEAK